MYEIISNTEQFKAQHRTALVKTLEDLGSLIVADIRETIADQYPPPSSAGTPPHRRLGLLQLGISNSTVDNSGGSVLEIISSARPGGDPKVPAYLEFGTKRMLQRPYMVPAKDRWADRVPGELVNGIRGNLGMSGGAAGAVEITSPPLVPDAAAAAVGV